MVHTAVARRLSLEMCELPRPSRLTQDGSLCAPLQAAAAEADVRDARMQAELREIGQVSAPVIQDLWEMLQDQSSHVGCIP